MNYRDFAEWWPLFGEVPIYGRTLALEVYAHRAENKASFELMFNKGKAEALGRGFMRFERIKLLAERIVSTDRDISRALKLGDTSGQFIEAFIAGYEFQIYDPEVENVAEKLTHSGFFFIGRFKKDTARMEAIELMKGCE